MLADLSHLGLDFFRTNSPLEKGGSAAGAGVVLGKGEGQWRRAATYEIG